jgi:nitroimidazol reductase NimA-like FMN-containing flavoprotein (pyridoxamine 5'-phosphate oxidase superfamily)
MARLRIPKTSPIVAEICKGAGIKLKGFRKPAEFEKEVVKYIEKNDIVHLATSKADVPRCTPLGYKNVGTILYILCEGGGKFANLKANPRVCYTIASRVKGRRSLASVQGLQCWGEAEVISMREDPKEFGKLISLWKIGEQFKKKGPKALPPFHYRIIKIVPHRMRMLNLHEGINNVTWTKR